MTSPQFPVTSGRAAVRPSNTLSSHAGRARGVALPESALLALALPRVDWCDAYAVSFPAAPPGQPRQWADAIFGSAPPWMSVLFGIREVLVRLVGIEPGGSHVFDTVAATDDEVLLGTDQKHLSFGSVLLEPSRGRPEHRGPGAQPPRAGVFGHDPAPPHRRAHIAHRAARTIGRSRAMTATRSCDPSA